MSQANDNLHFVITYSSGPLGVITGANYDDLSNKDGSDRWDVPIYARPARINSIFTNQPLPFHRYFVRGRR
jgi:hypothetical protein